jgi:lipopolysaccharide/colanic/teichoic acid biosynthesis glycosyltransferase
MRVPGSSATATTATEVVAAPTPRVDERPQASIPRVQGRLVEGRRAASAPDLPATEVVIITRNSEADLARSLEAIKDAAADAQASLLFIDLGSTDGTRTFAARHAPGSRGVWLTASDGLGEALTVAAAVSKAEVLMIVRATVQPCAAADITRLVRHLDQHPYAAMAAPALRAHDDSLLSTAHPEPEMTRFSPVEWALADAVAIRRTDLATVRPTRRRTAGWIEELDLCLQLRRRGLEIHYLRSVEWLDAGGRTTARVRPHHLTRRMALQLLRHPCTAGRLLSRTRTAGTLLNGFSRVLDVLVASLGILFTAPLLAAIALTIRLDTEGPVIFRQRRLGRHARAFQMYKFRTMRHGADSAVHADHVRNMIVNRLCADGSVTRQVFKVHPDPRVTRVGRLLRRSSLDELPQLFNILRGDMSLVGFRPPIPYEVTEYPDWYFRRFDGKPGLTGLWQVSGRNERSYEEMVRLDIEYFNRRSWLVDVKVLVRTVGVVITGRGAY